MNCKIAIAQINSESGNIELNSEKILAQTDVAKKSGAEIVLFPECSLSGFLTKETLQKFPFLYNKTDIYLEKIAKKSKNIIIVVGYIDNKTSKPAMAILKDEKITCIKTGKLINIELKQSTCGIFIGKHSLQNHIDNVADFIIDCNSVSISRKDTIAKQQKLQKLAKKLHKPIIHINPIGATDNLSFAGESSVYSDNGELIARAKSFEEDLFIVNPFSETKNINYAPICVAQNKFSTDYSQDMERTYKILVQGIKDYFNKCKIKHAVLGLSGGLDSTICAVLLADALGADNIYGISLPFKYTSEESKSDAKNLANNLGIHFLEVPIKQMVDVTKAEFSKLFEQIETEWNFRYKKSYTLDNIQARSRAMFLWGIANEFSSCIPIATSDKSEAYMGYATINGDMSGGFAPILDIPKTKLFALARWMNKNRTQKNAIPESIILKKPGAELAINPLTGKTLYAEEALMPYEFMDEVIWKIENKHETFSKMLKSKFIYEKNHKISPETKQEWLQKFFKRMSASLYKSYIMPPSIIHDYPTNNKTCCYQPITSGNINYTNT